MIANTKNLHQTYDDIADDYSQTIAIVNAFYSKFYIKNIPHQRQSLLDIGCGTGDILARLCKYFTHSYGIDPIKRFVRTAKHRAVASTVKIGSAEDLPFKDKSMDYVISHVVFQHVDRDRAIEEAIRVLRPGGRLIISEVMSQDNKYQASILNLYRRLPLNYFLLSHYGIRSAKQAKAYQKSANWKKLTSIHRARRFDLKQLQEFYSRKLPGAKFQQLSPKIVAAIWDKV